MRCLLRDLFSDVIEAVKEAGIWQTLTFDEREEVVNFPASFRLVDQGGPLAEVLLHDDVARNRRASAAGKRRNRA